MVRLALTFAVLAALLADAAAPAAALQPSFRVPQDVVHRLIAGAPRGTPALVRP